MNFDPVLAHQGGWDEVLILLSPVAVFALLRMFERRRRGRSKSPDAEPAPSDSPSDSPSDRPSDP